MVVDIGAKFKTSFRTYFETFMQTEGKPWQSHKFENVGFTGTE